MTTTPFAYQLLQFSYGEIEASTTLPSLRDIIEDVLLCDPDWVERGKLVVKASYTDRTEVRIGLEQFLVQVPLDMDALRAEARRMIAEDAAAQAEFFKQWGGSGTITGSPWLCDMGEDNVVEMLAKERGVRWKTLGEIDWVALEQSLVKESAP